MNSSQKSGKAEVSAVPSRADVSSNKVNQSPSVASPASLPPRVTEASGLPPSSIAELTSQSGPAGSNVAQTVNSQERRPGRSLENNLGMFQSF